MSNSDILKSILEKRWLENADFNNSQSKIQKYIGLFNGRLRADMRISAQVQGNHGIYTVSIELIDVNKGILKSACSCYIGKGGYCHHCSALARTFLNDPDSFKNVEIKKLSDIQRVDELEEYLKNTTLDSLTQQLKAKGITQQALAGSMGMPANHFSALKRSESRNHFFHELGAVKLACLWALEHLNKDVKVKQESKK
jgi:uncharacterized Zn finger protein